ncbi:methyltransferase domain-containing protein [Heliobacterium gestii]|uniref:Methyltransferase domain-containing protein n=1 Tax=Heliomicrobium gestii TaxID=2699 RepID=A0A845LEH4_HELGE|nr:class I SAM-dependent methyltransferase [Heliomicrobium gestii]MBM7866691.1 protein-L-isoaspartate(D-aspartate) O-methyltransferase [Heliomicrobium gestii]MZP43029.1 methyltransferase domain-containing protein [Heliomicrobium gestii]
MAEFDFVSDLHNRTKRDYISRGVQIDKAHCAEVSKQFGFDYWDGDRKYGYGGYRYDGRWRKVAERIAETYALRPGQAVLDVGCGKGFLLYELTQVVPGLVVSGIDISGYAVANAKEEVRPFLQEGKAQELPYADDAFDLVISFGTLHNLPVYDLKKAVQQIQRVTGRHAYIMVEAYRNEQEKINLLNWQLTCESFYSPEEWAWLFAEWGYQGDYGFIYFE